MKYLIPLFLLSGCATGSWRHEEPANPKFLQAKVKCQAMRGQAFIKGSEASDAHRFMRECLRGEGWNINQTPIEEMAVDQENSIDQTK